ncbi:MAG: hypothetical protein JWM05_654 [Acidimicrobiales bacterium]|nr:hypothetical protein [Acidimicrobiales bacterium]
MVFAKVDDFGYNLMLFLHIVAVIIAFAPAFVWPLVSVQLRKSGKPVGPTISELAGGNTQRIHGPALVAAGIFGFATLGMSNKLFKFSQTWVSIAMVLWFIAIGIMFGLMAPAEKKLANGDVAAEARLSMFGGMLHLLLALLLIDMIWKPGFP